jgi:hypothetical protein
MPWTHRSAARGAVTDPDLAVAAVTIARFAGVDDEGRFQVQFDGTPDMVVALSTVDLGAADVGRKILVAYPGGEEPRPVIVGRLRDRASTSGATVRIDGGRLVLEGKREIELRCGDASIVLTRAGKVLIRGSYVLSRSRGANRIRGSVVGIN